MSKHRIIVFVNGDIYGNYMLNLLQKSLKENDHHIMAIIIADPIKTKNPIPKNEELELAERGVPERLFFEIEHPKIYHSQANSNKQHDQNDKEEKFLTFTQIANAWKVPIMQLGDSDVNAPSVIALAKSLNPDLGLSLRFPQIFNQSLIQIPRIGIINAHSGLLPYYRGWLPSFWAMLDGKEEIGCTPHWITTKLDKGNILGEVKVKVEKGSDLVMNVMALYPSACKLLLDIITNLSKGIEIPGVAQDTSQGKTFSYPTPQHFKNFTEGGFKIVDWKKYKEFLSHWSAITPSNLPTTPQRRYSDGDIQFFAKDLTDNSRQVTGRSL